MFVLGGLALCTHNAYSQELHVIGSAGNYTEGTTHSIAWTVGEVIIVTGTDANNDVTQGFHQSNVHVLTVEEIQPLDISVYPNPARDILNIETSEASQMKIFDIQGKLVDTMDIISLTTSIDISYLSRGTYSLIFETKSGLAKRMKIIIM